MDLKELIAKRARLAELLERYSSGGLESINENEFGELKRDTTEDTMTMLRERIVDLDRRINDTD